MPGLVPGIHDFLMNSDANLKTWMAGTSPAMTQKSSTYTGTSNHSFKSFFTFPEAICTRCCSVTGKASSHFRPGSFFT
jgi:hypothetical protein